MYLSIPKSALFSKNISCRAVINYICMKPKNLNNNKMKNNILVLLMVSYISFLSVSCTSQAGGEKKLTFKVYGNCEMCKETIEGSLKNEKGISSAIWDVDKKMMSVSFDSTQTNLAAINEKIASVGYDTELKKGNDEAYKNLHKCCQYDRKQ
jgi:copper chaperone CopZ